MTPIVQGLPAIVLFGGALLVVLARPVPPRIHRWIPVVTCILAGVCLIALANSSTVPVELFEPNNALPALSLVLQWNGAALPFGLFVLVVLAGRFLFGIEGDSHAFSFGVL